MRVLVDASPVEIPDGSSVLDAIRAAGADVPSLCHDPRLSPAGSCRTCLVAVDGDTVAACTTPAREDAPVRTDDPAVRSAVRGVLELMLSELPPDALDGAGPVSYTHLTLPTTPYV